MIGTPRAFLRRDLVAWPFDPRCRFVELEELPLWDEDLAMQRRCATQGQQTRHTNTVGDQRRHRDHVQGGKAVHPPSPIREPAAPHDPRSAPACRPRLVLKHSQPDGSVARCCDTAILRCELHC